MNINSFIKTDYFLKKKIKRAIKENKRFHQFLSFAEIKDVLILFHIEDWYFIEEIIADLKKNNKNVIAWTIKQKDTANSNLIYPQEVRIIDPATDTSWQQTFLPSVIDEFENLKYDTLLDLTISFNPYLIYLLTINKSIFCLGIKESEEKIYDFIILKEEDKNLFETYEQMKFYIDNIFDTSNNS